jgi:sorbitol-specific phosphotransferase system component IIBC
VVVAIVRNPAFSHQAAGADAVLSKGQRRGPLLRLLRGDAERSAGCERAADLPLMGAPGAADEVWADRAVAETGQRQSPARQTSAEQRAGVVARFRKGAGEALHLAREFFEVSAARPQT